MTAQSPAPLMTVGRRAARSRVAWLAVLTAVVVMALGACTPESNRSMDLLNQDRNANGMGSLPMNIDLYLKAQSWSGELAGAQRLYHSNLADGNGYNWYRLGENVGYGSSLEQVEGAFMGSTAHRSNILDGGFNRVGVGVTRDDGGRYWVVQEFMQER